MRIIFAILVLFLANSCQNNSDKKNAGNHGQHSEKIYTCPMHPEIIRNKPGNCPICGMKLVEKIDNGKAVNNSAISIRLKPANEFFIGNIETTELKQMDMIDTINATGVIAYDTREINSVAARVSGRIDNLYVKYEFQPIKKGQKIMDIYSKELLTEQENLLFLIKNDPENQELIKSAEKRLILKGLNQEQIDKIKTEKKTSYLISVYSPYNGHLHGLNAKSLMNNEASTGSQMKSDGSPDTSPIIREGMFVQQGQTLFNIYNTQNVWAVINFSNLYVDNIHTGMPVIIKVDGFSKYLHAHINFIEPVIKKNQKTIAVRVYLKNPVQELKIGMIATAYIPSEKRIWNYVPITSVVHLGKSDVVFVQQGETFKSKKVIVGKTSNGLIEILSGLNKNEKIALNGQMLIDSESFIKTN